jgi:pimeloyl-ACP methyl ester carboxylesterase
VSAPEQLRVGDLAATLHLPSAPGPHPALVALHPANGPTRDLFLFRHLADVLPPIGIAVLLFDRRLGAEDRFEQQCRDALAVVDHLRGRKEIDPRRVGLWGYSQGGWVAPLAASRSDAVAFVVLLAACGVTPAEQMRYGTAFHLRKAGYDEAAVSEMLAARGAWESFERGQLSRSEAEATIEAVRTRPWFPLAFVPPVLPPGPGEWPTIDFDPAPIFASVRVPVLAFYGEEDEWVPVDASLDALRRAGIPDLTVVRLRGTGHAPTPGGSERIEDIVPAYTDTLLTWLARRTTPAPAAS